jgi:hypothetical protein
MAKPEGGGKPQWFIRSDRVKSVEVVEIAATPAVDIGKLGNMATEKLGEKVSIYEEWRAEIKAAMHFHGPNAQRLTKEQVTQRFVTRYRERGIKISVRTLRRMEKKVQTGKSTAALIDGRSIRQGTVQGNNPFLAFVRTRYLTREGLSVRYCHVLAKQKAQENGWRVWSLRKTQKYVESIPLAERVFARKGEKIYVDECEEYIDRDWEPVRSNEQWGSDHHKLDLFVRIGETVDQVTGEVKYTHVRPTITVWIDNSSRKHLAFDLYAGDPCTDNIIVSFRRAVLAYGAPLKVYVDNGKDYDSYALHGRTKRERWKRSEINGTFIFGTFAALGVEAHNVQKYHGQSKLIERFFGTMENQFCRLFPDAYCGNSPANRPEGLQERLDAGKAPTMEEVKAAFVEWAENIYNLNPHTGQGMNGKSPNQVYDEKLDVKRTADERMLNLLLLKHTKPVKVTQNGVWCNGFQYGKSNDLLREMMGKKVVCGFDPDAPHRITIFSLEGRVICAAESNKRLPANATAEVMQAAMKAKRHARKAELKYREVRPHIYETSQEIMFRLAASKAASEKSRLKTDPPTPPNVKPIRSPFESQLPEIEKAMKAPLLKKAAGAEGFDLFRFANENIELSTPTPARSSFNLLKMFNEQAPTDGSDGGSSCQ